MRRIEFLREPMAYLNNFEYIAYLHHVNGEDELFEKLKKILKFPDYFGYNWNAVYDCLRDFNWITTEGVVLVHIELPELTQEKLKNYIEMLVDVVQDWKEGEEHYFKVIFPESAKDLIKQYIL